MKTKCLTSLLVAALCLPLCPSLRGQTNGGGFNLGNIGPSGAQVYGGIVGGAAAVGVITYLAIHYSKKRAVTGCITSAENGMTVTDEKDHQTYVLSGNTADITPGARLKVAGKKVKSKTADATLDWRATKVKKNFGACQAHG